MDRYLFNQFVFEMDDELYNDSCVVLAKSAKNIIKKPEDKRVTFNYYPPEECRMQLVIKGVMENNSVDIGDIKMHHSSEDVWKLKIVAAIDKSEGSYLASRPDGSGLVAIRLVNEQVLDSVESDSIIEAQVAALALNLNIYKDAQAYAESVKPSADGRKLVLKDGLVIATDYLVNNSAHLTEEQRKNKEHCFDNLVDICGTITKCDSISLKMLGMDLNDYYWANIMTDFGQLKIVFALPALPENVEGFGVGNVIVCKAMLSGDVCIYDYDKYISPLGAN